jgi:hypothetical protein
MLELQQDNICISASGNPGTQSLGRGLKLAILLLHYHVLVSN